MVLCYGYQSLDAWSGEGSTASLYCGWFPDRDMPIDMTIDGLSSNLTHVMCW